MTDTEPAKMEQVGKKRTFTLITTNANNLIKKCKNALDEDKLAVVVEGLEEATREFLSIMLEKLELPEIIEHTPKAKALYDLDISGLFCLEKQEMEQAKVSQEEKSLIKIFQAKYGIFRFCPCWKVCAQISIRSNKGSTSWNRVKNRTKRSNRTRSSGCRTK